MSEFKSVILKKQIMHCEGGRWRRFLPSKNGTITELPMSVFNAIKDSKPKPYEIPETTLPDRGIEISMDMDMNIENTSTTTGGEKVPAKSIDISFEDEAPSGAPVPPSMVPPVAVSGSSDVKTIAVAELQKIDGIGASLANTLYEEGICSLEDVVGTDKEELIAIKGISANTVDGIQTSAKELIGA